jgi:chromosome segregation ATPase
MTSCASPDKASAVARVDPSRGLRRGGATHSLLEAAVNPEDQTQYKALLEALEKEVRVIAEGHGANAKDIKDLQTELEQYRKQLDHRFMVTEVDVGQKLEALDHRLSGEIASITARLDEIEAALPGRRAPPSALKPRKPR